MKFRILAPLFLLLALGGLYVIFHEDTDLQPATHTIPSSEGIKF